MGHIMPEVLFMKIVNLDQCELSLKNGTYTGAAGSKDGIIYENAEWLIKYPKSIRGLERTGGASYSTSPLSEFIGSKIYSILGYDVHETFLAERNGKIVVACKDFTGDKKLLEIRAIKNYTNKELAEKLDRDFDSTGSDHYVDLDELLLHLRYNDILTNIAGINERFWEQAVVDIFINNNDRNNGNWGILRDTKGHDELAPIFDNGGCLQTKISEEKIAVQILKENIERTKQNASNIQTAYAINGHILSGASFLGLSNQYIGLKCAIEKVVPNIQKKFPEIIDFISDIPETYKGLNNQEYTVCSDNRKKLYILQLQSRYEDMLKTVYEELSKAPKLHRGR